MRYATPEELKAEGAAFKAQYGTLNPGDDFCTKIAKGASIRPPSTLSPTQDYSRERSLSRATP